MVFSHEDTKSQKKESGIRRQESAKTRKMSAIKG